jgi:hypothetical protein
MKSNAMRVFVSCEFAIESNAGTDTSTMKFDYDDSDSGENEASISHGAMISAEIWKFGALLKNLVHWEVRVE